MNSNFIFVFVAVLALSLASCEGSLEDEKRVSNEREIENYLSKIKLNFVKENGVYYAPILKGHGYSITPGDSIYFWYVGYTLDGNIFDTNNPQVAIDNGFDLTSKDFIPLFTIAGSSDFIEGVNRGLLLCREGEQGIILFPSSMGFVDNTVQSIEPWSALAYEILIINVNNPEIIEEQNIINNFVASSSGFTQDSTGLWFKYLKQDIVGSQPILGDTIYGWYKEQSITGTIINELTAEGEEMILRFDHLNEALIYSYIKMKPGEEMQVIAPSSLTYGIEGTENVEPYAPIIYELRLDSIK